jgi:phosphate:Na+ symporter
MVRSLFALLFLLLIIPLKAYTAQDAATTTAALSEALMSAEAAQDSMMDPGEMNDALQPGTDFPRMIEFPPNSGDHQHQRVKKSLDLPLRVRVTNSSGHPVAYDTVYFQLLSAPGGSSGFTIEDPKTLTDATGLAQTRITLGSEPGIYQVSARIKDGGDPDLLVFTLNARKSQWVFFLVFGMLGGLALFLVGMDMMSEGMKKSAGDRLRTILGSLTRNRLLGVGLGTFVTMIIQSSSATSVMLVGFVNSKLMKFRRTIGIILGANIGTTITAQLIAFKLTDYALLIIVIGFLLLYFAKKQGIKYIGQAILGFGILFFGMHIMSEAMHPLRTYYPFIDLLQGLEHLLPGILVGMIFTALLQSSSAFIGITIVLAGQGLITLEAAIPLLLGSNIGTAITAFLASINTTREAKKVAIVNAIINTFGMLLFVLWVPEFAGIMERISDTVARQIANAHTLFNLTVAAVLLPFTGLLARLTDRLLPEKEAGEEELMKAQFLDDNLLTTPVLALNLAKQEALRIGSVTQDMLTEIIVPFLVKQDHLLPEIEKKEKQVDYLVDAVNSYLVNLSRQSTDQKSTAEAFQIMYTIKELEEISDIIGNLLVKRAEEWIASDVEFSEQGKKELAAYHTLTQKQLSRALDVFNEVNLEKAREMKEKHSKYRAIASEMEKHHYERLRRPDRKLEASGDTHMELMTRFRTVSHHATNIARILLDWKSGENTTML